MSRKFNLIQPSHIRSSCDYIKRMRGQIDLVIHLIDSRSVSISSNLDMETLFGYKKVLTIYSKSDLSDSFASESNCFNLKENNVRRKIIKLIKETLKEKHSKKQLIYNPCSQIMIVGIPNVGKSTLINLLKQTKSAKNENSPGTTKQVAKFYIGDNIWIYDTPGILFPKLNKTESIKKLFLLNSLPINHEYNSVFLESAFIYIKNHYPKKITDLTNEIPDCYQNFLLLLTKKFNLKNKNNSPSIENAEQKFKFLIHNGKLGKIQWDKEWQVEI